MKAKKREPAGKAIKKTARKTAGVGLKSTLHPDSGSLNPAGFGEAWVKAEGEAVGYSPQLEAEKLKWRRADALNEAEQALEIASVAIRLLSAALERARC